MGFWVRSMLYIASCIELSAFHPFVILGAHQLAFCSLINEAQPVNLCEIVKKCPLALHLQLAINLISSSEREGNRKVSNLHLTTTAL